MRTFVCILLSYLCLCLMACTKEYYNPIPVRRVYLEVDLNYRDKELQAFASHKIFTSKNTINGKEQTGFAGVLVTCTLFGEYKAFDAACPHEARTDAVIEIDEEYNAVCKVCGSKYEVILNYGSGACIGGPSKHPLRLYRTSLSGNMLIVRNY